MRARLLIVGSSLAMLGWGAVLPYQYAYAATTRGWGSMVAALASTLFSVGALLAAPIGGRLADRFSPVAVTVIARLIAATGVGSLIAADSASSFLAGMFVFGIGVTSAGPAQTVLVLRWVPDSDRRTIFAWQFTGAALGMAIGSFAAGYVVDLDQTNGMWPAFATAAAGFLACAAIIAIASIGAPSHDLSQTPADVPSASRGAVLRLIFGNPALRWTAVITATLALGFYAQFEAGLPAYALTELHVQERTIGLAAAVNCAVILVLQMIVVKRTANRSSATLLIGVGTIWVISWLLLAAAGFFPAAAATLFVVAYGVFGIGETMYAPVLNPLTASLAPAGYVGSTLGIFAALQTGISAIGPLIAGVMLGAGWSAAFIAVHIAISCLAVYAAWRLRAVMRASAQASAETAPALTGGSDVVAGARS